MLTGRMFPVDVAHVGMAALDSSRAGELESLLCSGVGFHFRHNRMQFENVRTFKKARKGILRCQKTKPGLKNVRGQVARGEISDSTR